MLLLVLFIQIVLHTGLELSEIQTAEWESVIGFECTLNSSHLEMVCLINKCSS